LITAAFSYFGLRSVPFSLGCARLHRRSYRILPFNARALVARSRCSFGLVDAVLRSHFLRAHRCLFSAVATLFSLRSAAVVRPLRSERDCSTVPVARVTFSVAHGLLQVSWFVTFCAPFRLPVLVLPPRVHPRIHCHCVWIARLRAVLIRLPDFLLPFVLVPRLILPTARVCAFYAPAVHARSCVVPALLPFWIADLQLFPLLLLRLLPYGCADFLRAFVAFVDWLPLFHLIPQ